jgi:hypothetical protein
MSNRKEKDYCRSRGSRLFNGLGQNILLFITLAYYLSFAYLSFLHVASARTPFSISIYSHQNFLPDFESLRWVTYGLFCRSFR